jgi:cellulase-like Ig domain-containing protein/glycosyl hydrolase family 9
METKSHRIWQLRYPIVFILFPFFIWALLVYIGLQGIENTILGRYEYIGTESVNWFGYLDLAHYRATAREELLSWQFFFGNLQYFIIFSLIMAGIFLRYTPREFVLKIRTRIADSKTKVRKSIIITGMSLIAIIIFEIIISLIGDPLIGLGSKTFIGQYYQDIPTLISEGYIPHNTIPNDSQIPLTFVPILFGVGSFAYFLGQKELKNQKKISSRLNNTNQKGIGKMILGIGMFYLLIKCITMNASAQTILTGYSLIMLIIWMISAVGITGAIMLYQQKIGFLTENEEEGDLDPPQKRILKDLFAFISIVIIFISTLYLIIMPYLAYSNLGSEDVSFPGIIFLQIGVIVCVIILYIIIFRKMKANDALSLERKTYLSLYRGLGAFFALLGYFLVKKFVNAIEIMWLYNAVIPMIFMGFLTFLFYNIGLWLDLTAQKSGTSSLKKQNFLQKIARILEKSEKSTDEINKKRIIAVSTLLFVVIGAGIPTTIGYKVFGEHPTIILNQVGMLSQQEKIFFLRMDYDHDLVGTWELIDTKTKAIIKTGSLEAKGYRWKNYYWAGNFSEVSTEGEYIVRAKLGPYSTESYPFVISSTYLDDVYRTGLYWYYYMRCGTEVQEIVPGYSGHEKCHEHFPFYREKLPNGTLVVHNDRNLTGGWHDSGDYNCYGHRIAPVSIALTWTYQQTPGFFNLKPNLATYPENDSVPDILEESWFGVKFWKQRWYEPEGKFFDSSSLGNHQHIRWTVFGPPEYEDYFGGYQGEPGRWIHDEYEAQPGDSEEDGWYEGQFLLMDHHGPGIVAFLAGFINICDEIGWQPGNRSELVQLTLDAHESYASNIKANYYGINCELELYKLTGNQTYFQNAVKLAESVLNSINLADFNNLASALDFAQQYDGVLGCDLLAKLPAWGVIENLWKNLQNRTAEEDGNNIFRYLRNSWEGPPVYNNGKYFSAMHAACYGYNLTTNATHRRDFLNFITRHYDWTLGKNFENICQLEGVPGGDQYVYQLHSHRYRFIPGVMRGGCPGFILDGFDRYPDDYGTSKSHSEDNNCNSADYYVIEPESNLYTETWSDLTFRFMMMNGAFYRLVLNRN